MDNIISTLIGTYTPISYSMYIGVYDATAGLVDWKTSDVIPNGFSGVDWVFIAKLVILMYVLKLIYIFAIKGMDVLAGKK